MNDFEHERTISTYPDFVWQQVDLIEPVAPAVKALEPHPIDRLLDAFVLDYGFEQNQIEAMRPLVEAGGAFITFREIMQSLEQAGVAQSPRSVTRALEKVRKKGAFLKTAENNRSTYYAIDQDVLDAQQRVVDTRNTQQKEIEALLDNGVQDFFLQRIDLSQADEHTKQSLRLILRNLRQGAGWPQRLEALVADIHSHRSPSVLLHTLIQILPDGVLASNESSRVRTYWYDYSVLDNLKQSNELIPVQTGLGDIEAIEDKYSGVRHGHRIRSVLAAYVLAHLESEQGVTTRQKLVASLHHDGLYDRRHLLVNAFQALTRHGIVEVSPTQESVYGKIALSGAFNVASYEALALKASLKASQKEQSRKEVLKEVADARIDVYEPEIKTANPVKRWPRNSLFLPEEQALREGLEHIVPSDNPTLLQDLYSVLKSFGGRIDYRELERHGFNPGSVIPVLKGVFTTNGSSVFSVHGSVVRLAPAVRSSRHSIVFTQN